MPDVGGGVNLGALVAGLGTFFGFLGSSISDALRFTINAFKGALQLLASIAKNLFTHLFYTLRDFLAGVLKPLLARLKGWAAWLRAHLASLMRPIVDWIKRIHAVIRDIFNAYVRPVLEAISLLREFLALTRLNQTAFGGALDLELSKISDQISGKFLLIESTFNRFATRFEDLVGRVDRILAIPVLISTIFGELGALATAFWNDQIKQVSANGRRILVDLKLKPPLKEKERELTTFLTDKSGLLLPSIERHTGRAMHVARGGAADWLDYDR